MHAHVRCDDTMSPSMSPYLCRHAAEPTPPHPKPLHCALCRCAWSIRPILTVCTNFAVKLVERNDPMHAGTVLLVLKLCSLPGQVAHRPRCDAIINTFHEMTRL
jgi:hypothetical protein